MPAIREDQVISSSEEEVEDKSSPSGERWRRRESSTSLLDKVVKENRVYGTVSPYGDSFEEQEEEWTVLAAQDKDEATPLIHQKMPFTSSLRRNVDPTMCFLAMVTFVMAMLVCIIWVIPGVFTHTVVIAPNETVMAAYEVDPLVTANIVYRVTSTMKEEDEEDEEREQLMFYREKCDDIDRLSAELDVSNHLEIPADTSRMEISRLYLAADSSIQYTVNLSRPSPVKESPSSCYASIHLYEDYLSLRSFLSSSDTRGADYSYEFCGNTTNVSFSLDAKKSSYSFLALSLASPGQIRSVNLTMSGTVFYYNSTLHDDNLVCMLTPPINSTCEIPTSDESDQAKLCVLITRGVPHAPAITVATGNHTALASNVNVNKDDDIIQLERRRTTFWGINRVYIFACLFVPILMSSCVLTILSPRRANYGAYIRSGRKKMVK